MTRSPRAAAGRRPGKRGRAVRSGGSVAARRLGVRRGVALLAAGAALAAVQPAAAEPTPVRALVVTGGHDFDREAFEEMLGALDGVRWTGAAHTSAADVWDRGDLDRFDAVVLYDMVQESTAEQRAALAALVGRGTGVVALHHALVAHQRWPGYERLIGGRYPENPDAPGRVTEQVGYEHDVEIPLEIATPDHPVVEGLSDFTLHDEIYWGFRVSADVTPLLTTPHARSGNPLAWARTEGRTRVVVIQPGHGPEAFRDPRYRRLLARAIRWVAGALDDGPVEGTP